MSTPLANPDDREPNRRSTRWILLVVRCLVLCLVSWGIWQTVGRALPQLEQRGFSLRQVNPYWFLWGCLFYLAGLSPCWLFWHRTLVAMGQGPTCRESLRAFWIGHLGKYVPGKAMVVVLRSGLVQSERVSWTVAAVSVFIETLSMMAVGAFLASAILVVISQHWPLTCLAFALMICSGVPTIPPVFRGLVRLLRVKRANDQIDRALAGVDFRLMGMGWIGIGFGWILLGLSLWAMLSALPLVHSSLWDLPLLTATVALAMVAGFLSLIPGGLGVRDWILMELLAPHYGADVALVSAVLVRLSWLLSELLASAILYLDVHRARRTSVALAATKSARSC